ncbi:NADPH-ferrihemoprotein reductase [Fusarium austroafricanum]|uniref:NADPH--cytochrome P450 reductase n=1 Tax=Fusarium austroafricanum TaxID=2364996 RepID=A0A8H4KJ08_9HYPO|nr:NADPH-ferrihemoprotein reductase [Fusarium austroafricanum]
MPNIFATEAITRLSELGPPHTIADIAALSAVGVASAAYLLRGIVWDKPDPYHHLWFERMGSKDAVSSPKATRNIAKKLEQAGKDVVIFWGSQSGTAEAFANRLSKECHLRFGLETLCADLCDYDPESISNLPQRKLAIFIISTYGEGDPSDNTAVFWEWLHKSSDIQLPNLRYIAFGLGNTSYRFYNRVIDVVAEFLDKAGAQRLMTVGKANDAQGGTEEDFLSWKHDLYAHFQEKLGYEERDIPYAPSIQLVEDESLDIMDLNLGEPIQNRSGPARIIKQYSAVHPLAIKSSRELYTSPGRSCLHMELDISDQAELRYRTGDHLAVYPINPDHEIQLLLKALDLEDRADKPLLVQPLEKGVAIKIPSPTSALALFRHYLEVSAPVSRETVGQLARFAPLPEASRTLTALGKSKETYAAYIAQNHVTLGRLLSLVAPGVVWDKLPLSYVVEILPTLQPRYYSISSSSIVSSRKLSITVGVDNSPLQQCPNKCIRGITTNYLYALGNSLKGDITQAGAGPGTSKYALSGPGDMLKDHKVFACLRRSNFKLPSTSSTPLILVGAGTGIAPFRGFILERARLKAVGKHIGKMMLFFGCRSPDQDYLYKDELAEIAEELKDSIEIITAFSRADGQAKKYVQDKIEERKKDVCDLLQHSASIYFCGRASMAREAGNVVEESMKMQNNWTDAETRCWVESEKKGNKWLEDVWG